MTKIIGLTGGIGSGKTTVANYFNELGVSVYIADNEAKKISEKPEIIAEIEKVFGSQIIQNDKINKEKLGNIVFNNPEKLKQLNAIIHPEVKKHFDKWVLKHSNFNFVIKEAAILFESGSYEDCDKIISVVAPLELRIQRVMERDSISKEDVLKRINNQWNDEQRIAKSDFVIHNIDIEQTKKEIKEILKKLSIL
jgi:dephospho-CoA kinase